MRLKANGKQIREAMMKKGFAPTVGGIERRLKANEKQIREAIVEGLQYSGWFTFFLWQGLGAYKGISDLIAVKDGRVLFIEIKTENGTQSHHQKQFQRDIELAGGEYLLFRNFEEAKQTLNLPVLL